MLKGKKERDYEFSVCIKSGYLSVLLKGTRGEGTRRLSASNRINGCLKDTIFKAYGEQLGLFTRFPLIHDIRKGSTNS